MEKIFVYEVNGETFEDVEAFGKAWKQAKEVATKEHTCITRQVINGENIKNEFYTNAGFFQNERFYDKDKVKIF
jgi:hypothetical protein